MTGAIFTFSVALAAGIAEPTRLWETAMNDARIAQSRQQFGEAESKFRSAAEAASSPLLRASSLNMLGSLQVQQARFAEAEKSYLEAAKLVQASHRPLDRRIASNLSTLYLETGQWTRAEQIARRFTEEVDSGFSDHDGAVLLSNLGAVHLQKKRYKEAERLLLATVRGLDGATDDEGRQIRAMAMGNLAEVLSRTGHIEEARRAAEESLAVLESIGFDTIPDAVVKATANVAMMAAAAGHSKEAQIHFQKAIRDAEQAFGTDSYMVGVVLRSYGVYLRRERRGREARAAEARSVRILTSSARENTLGFTVEAGALLLKQ